MAKILIIDDSAVSRNIIARMLAEAGHDTVKAASAAEGLEQHRQDPVELVITDIYMPETDGYETIRLFRSVSPEPRMLAISGGSNFGKRGVLDIAKEFGACCVLRKPVLSDELTETVRVCLTESQKAGTIETVEQAGSHE